MSNNPLLVEINADHNLLTSFNISENTNLENLYCSNNDTLTEIDVTQNTAIVIFWCRNNQLTGTLDLSNAIGLTQVICDHNDLIIINLANGNNQNINSWNLDFNPNLEFVYVDNPDSFFGSFLAGTLPHAQITTDPDATASSESDTLNKYISVYPNPTADYLYIETDKKISSIEIFDFKGNRVLSKNENNINKMSLYNLASGVYFCKIEDDQGLNGFIKFIKK